MKRFFLIAMAVLMGATTLAQNQPDAEYKLIRRSYKTNSDGSMDINFRKEIKLIRNRAFTAYADKGETFITYNPQFETLTINECYTIMADGTKVETPENAFVLQLPSECTDCGRLNGIREMAIVHTALEYNCMIVLDYTIHRNSSLLVERFNFKQDCPVLRYEVRYADGHTQVETNITQAVNEPYMPAKKDYDVEFQLGERPTFVAEKRLDKAFNILQELKQNDPKAYVAAIRDWVVDNVKLNPVDLRHVNYTMTPAEEVFLSNCGTCLDKTGLLAAMLNEAGFKATIVDNSMNVFGDRPMEVEVTIQNNTYRISATHKGELLTEQAKTDAAAVAAAPVYVERELEWKPDTLADGFVRITLPNEKSLLNINPAYLTSSRTSDLQAVVTNEFYHYTMDLPKGAKLIGGDVDIEYTKYDLGSINIKIKQKGKRLLVTRQLQLRKAIITKQDYRNFRQLMIDWNSHKELLFSL